MPSWCAYNAMAMARRLGSAVRWQLARRRAAVAPSRSLRCGVAQSSLLPTKLGCMERALIALGLVLLSVPILLGVTRGLFEALLIAPVLGALAYFVLLRDWE